MMFRRTLCLFFCIVILASLLTAEISAVFAEKDKIVVVLDPGHGGADPGSAGTYAEAYYNLKVAQYCADALNKNGNFTVKMTRSSQSEGLKLAQRGLYADSVNADIIVSIHFNSSTSPSVNGIEIYTSVLDKYDLSGLARITADKLSKATGLSVRGCFEKYDTGDSTGIYYWNEKYQWDVPNDPSVGSLSDYYGIITWGAKFGFPGMIIEHAYLSSPSDLAVADKEANLKKMGEADAAALIEYYTNHTHSYASAYTQDYPVSCFSCGKKSIRCTVCGHRTDVTTVAASPDPNAHLWITENYAEPTCSSDGYIDMYCRYTHNLVDKGCEQFEEHTKHVTLAKTEHNYQITYSQPLTHTQDGINTYTCTYCGNTYTETEPAEGHSYVLLGYTAPTCTEDGGTSYQCKICGEVYTETQPAVGHVNVEIDRTEPSCTEDGEIKYECSVCGEITAEIIDCPGHSYETETETPASCASDGIVNYRCTVCRDQYTESLPATGHDYEPVSHIPAGCENDGFTVYECKLCHDSYEEKLEAVGHNWDEGKPEKEASFFGSGIISYTCLNDSSHIRIEKNDPICISFIKEHRIPIVFICICIILAASGTAVVLILMKKRRQKSTQPVTTEAAGFSEAEALPDSDKVTKTGSLHDSGTDAETESDITDSDIADSDSGETDTDAFFEPDECPVQDGSASVPDTEEAAEKPSQTVLSPDIREDTLPETDGASSSASDED